MVVRERHAPLLRCPPSRSVQKPLRASGRREEEEEEEGGRAEEVVGECREVSTVEKKHTLFETLSSPKASLIIYCQVLIGDGF